MKIDKPVTFPNTVSNTSAPGSAKDGVSASRLAAEPAAASASLRPASTSALLPSTQGDFDAARVAEIRANISAGRYQIDTGKIADGLLATVRDLLGIRPA